MRLRCPRGAFAASDVPYLRALLEVQEGIGRVVASPRTGSLLVYYGAGRRSFVLAAVAALDRSLWVPVGVPLPVVSSEPWVGAPFLAMAGRIVGKMLLPVGLRRVVTTVRALPLVGKGLRTLFRRRGLDVSVLDASAVGISLMRKDFRTASVITTLLALGELLERWTQKASNDSLAASLAVHADHVWVRKGGTEVQIPLAELERDDLVVVRAGAMIPVDGVVVDGDAVVNQASMTGESQGVHRRAGLSVYAGTVVEEGALVVRVTAVEKETRIHKIVELVEASETLKAAIQGRAERLADAVVPYSFLLAGLVYVCTGNAIQASAALLVDYSCAIKLATPLAILAAMREGVQRGILVKGGKFLEALEEADTVVFDKTGTLTVSSPTVVGVVPFDGFDRDEVLRTAACLEEHFPHSIARAVVRKAEEEGIAHREEHSQVEYAVAHGIVSRLRGERVVLGSAHFVFEDEGIPRNASQDAVIHRELGRHSVLYLAIGGRLAGIVCVDDPVRPEAHGVVTDLKKEGIDRLVMLTGDHARVAGHVGALLGLDDARAELLPEEKTAFVRHLRDAGRRVIMVGDGINDSPALAAADVGISMKSGADITREVADVLLLDDRLGGVVTARRLGSAVMRKIRGNCRWIIGINSVLLFLGLSGGLSPAASALLHNIATVGASLYAIRPVLGGNPRSKPRRDGDDCEFL